MPLVQIFIATHNRPSLVLNAVHSALNQNFESFEVIVSDNSTNDETEILLAKIRDSRFHYKRRMPPLPPIEHLNAILKDVTAEYFMIFHDDDVMHPEMLTVLYKKIYDRKEEVVAIGSNAKVIKNGKLRRKNLNDKLKYDITIKNRSYLAKLYLNDFIVPFPSYLYRKKVAIELSLNPDHGGKYCDAAFIIDITSLGAIVFCAAPLMDSYKHSSQDSFTNAFTDRNKLINYIIKTTNYSKKDKDIIKYRVGNIYAELKKEILSGEIPLFYKKYFNRLVLLFKLSTLECFPKIILLTLFSCLKSKKTIL